MHVYSIKMTNIHVTLPTDFTYHAYYKEKMGDHGRVNYVFVFGHFRSD